MKQRHLFLGALAAARGSCDVLLESKEVLCLGADRLHSVLLGVGVHIISCMHFRFHVSARVAGDGF